jgi:hypothetical protein
METEDIGSTLIIAVSVVLLGALFIGRQIYAGDHSGANKPPVEAKASDSQTVTVLVHEAAPSDSSIVLRHVFQCVVNGQRVFSDSRCAPDAKTFAIQESNRMAPPQLVYSLGVDLRGPVRSDNEEGEAQETSKKKCAYIEESIEHLNERMRHGYGSAEGEQLHQRYRDLNNQLDDCKRHGR